MLDANVKWFHMGRDDSQAPFSSWKRFVVGSCVTMLPSTFSRLLSPEILLRSILPSFYFKLSLLEMALPSNFTRLSSRTTSLAFVCFKRGNDFTSLSTIENYSIIYTLFPHLATAYKHLGNTILRNYYRTFGSALPPSQ